MLIETVNFLLHLHSAVPVDLSWFDCHRMSCWYSTKVCYISVLRYCCKYKCVFFFSFYCMLHKYVTFVQRVHKIPRIVSCVVRLFVAAKAKPCTCDYTWLRLVRRKSEHYLRNLQRPEQKVAASQFLDKMSTSFSTRDLCTCQLILSYIFVEQTVHGLGKCCAECCATSFWHQLGILRMRHGA